MRAQRPVFDIDPVRLAGGEDLVGAAIDFASGHMSSGPVLISASATPEAVRDVQEKLGRERAGTLIETALAEIAKRLVARGVRRLVVAGGETSGAVVQALGIKGLRIGKQIDPGVPWTATIGDPPIALALKSGNFGGTDFFLRSFTVLP
jgi:3-dehydrotetronate 4-kinase